MDARTRQGFLAVQFERLAQGVENRSIALDTPAGRFLLTRHGNAITCVCQLDPDDPTRQAALVRRGAVDGLFVISPKLVPSEFGLWLDRLLVDDLGADPLGNVFVLAMDALLT
ncbi:MAG TPA: hypothetical protein VMV93_03220 [Chloroflexota bacterium]|nr:hypothetical protein [Chloroflexota bacterium]